MVEPVISTGAALVGAGAWFGEKLLGPSATAIGDKLKIFVNSRLDKIFQRTQQIGLAEGAKELPPGFAYLALQRASFSEDHDSITNMWAQLLVSSANKFSQRNALYIEILAQLTSEEAEYLEGLAIPVMIGEHSVAHGYDHFEADLYRFVESITVEMKPGGVNTSKILDHFHDETLPVSNWPYIITAVHYRDKVVRKAIGGSVSSSANSTGMPLQSSFDVLSRQQIMRKASVVRDVPEYNLTVQAYYLTKLGAEFMLTCRGGW